LLRFRGKCVGARNFATGVVVGVSEPLVSGAGQPSKASPSVISTGSDSKVLPVILVP